MLPTSGLIHSCGSRMMKVALCQNSYSVCDNSHQVFNIFWKTVALHGIVEDYVLGLGKK